MAAGLVVVASAQGALPLQQRVLAPSELPGFAINGPPEIVPSPAAWYRVKFSHRFQDSAALRARGFVVGAREQLTGSNAQALSAVIEFKSPRGARKMVGQTIADLRSGSYALKRFAVPGIPGAQAAASSTVNDKGLSIAFADGRFWYLVSVRYPPKAAKPPQRTSLIAAARALYRRVHSA
jgi:hypothetical protein